MEYLRSPESAHINLGPALFRDRSKIEMFYGLVTVTEYTGG
jgi:hypothetical protein